jgi:hypothetical protein
MAEHGRERRGRSVYIYIYIYIYMIYIYMYICICICTTIITTRLPHQERLEAASPGTNEGSERPTTSQERPVAKAQSFQTASSKSTAAWRVVRKPHERDQLR